MTLTEYLRWKLCQYGAGEVDYDHFRKAVQIVAGE